VRHGYPRRSAALGAALGIPWFSFYTSVRFCCSFKTKKGDADISYITLACNLKFEILSFFLEKATYINISTSTSTDVYSYSLLHHSKVFLPHQKIKVSYTSSSCQSEHLLAPKTAARIQDCPPPYHASRLGNSKLLATTSHAGLLANFVGASHAGFLAKFVVHCQQMRGP
jgi:hypothetical protein